MTDFLQSEPELPEADVAHGAEARRLGEYRLIREVGRGAISVVYQAVDTRIGRAVALKVLSAPLGRTPAQQEAQVSRLQREARLVSHLSHPNIVGIYDVGERDGSHFLAMEYLRGTTLRERLDEGPIPLAEAARILTQVGAALEAVHRAGVVHRDIKPSNVMLLPEGPVKLLDFGVARQRDDTAMTQTGMIVGSPAYLSPEQVVGGDATPASDIWALGVLLYEMLAGHSPFAGPSIPAALYQITHKRPAPLRGAPLAVQRVVERALEKDPARRYQTATEMTDALQQSLTRAAPRFRLHRRYWAALLIPILIAAGLAARHSAPPTPATAAHAQMQSAVPDSTPATPTVTIQETAPPARPPYPAAPTIHPAKPSAAIRHTPAASAVATRRRRRILAAYRRRPRRHLAKPAYRSRRAPSQSMQALQKFIWSEGR